MMAGEPRASAATWERRFRATRTLWVRMAARRPDRGLVCTSLSGSFQIHRWVVGEPPGAALTANPEGRTSAWISPDGEWVVWHADVAGNELGHFVVVPWSGGEEGDLTPDLPEYASVSAAFDADGAFVASIVGPARQMEAYVAEAERLGKVIETDWFDAGHGHGATQTRVDWCRRSIEFVERALGMESTRPA